jgi:acetyltransferase-like isoleucine patch superfamily enzyme
MTFIKYIQKILLIFFSYLPSNLKLFFYRIMGSAIGKNVELGFGSFIIPFVSGFNKINIGNNVIIGDHVHILSKNLLIGDGGQIKDNTRIWGQSDFSMGTGTYIDQECHFDLRRNIILGKDVVISAGSWLFTHMISHSVLDGSPSKFGPIVIKDRTYLGANTFILPDITIEHDSIVGARAVVTKNVHPDSVVVGNPAREIGHTSERIKKLSIEDKRILIKNIFSEFIEMFPERVSLISQRENCFVMKMNNLHIVFISEIENESFINNIIRKYGMPLTLVSFGFPDSIKKIFTNQKIFWIDLNTSTHSLKSNKNNRFLENFLRNYGINIS